MAAESVLVGGGEEGDDPANDVTFGGDGLPLEVLADLRVEDGQEPFELVHLQLEDFELVDENFLEPVLHQVLEDTIGMLLMSGLDVNVSSKVVHALTVADVLVEIGISSQQRV